MFCNLLHHPLNVKLLQFNKYNKLIKAKRNTLFVYLNKQRGNNPTSIQTSTIQRTLQQDSAFNGTHKKYNDMSKLRPDFVLQDTHGREGLIGEDKKSENLLGVAQNEVTDKCYRLNPHQYNGIVNSFAYAVRGSFLNLYLIDHDKDKCIFPSLLIYFLKSDCFASYFSY